MTETQIDASWLALLGEWDFSDPNAITFVGKPQPSEGADAAPPDPSHSPATERPSIGLALSDQPFTGGTVEATFRFEEAESSGGEVVLAYNPETREMLSAGITGLAIGGGTLDMFGVREFIRAPTVKGEAHQTGAGPYWNTLGASGVRSSLEVGKSYHVRVSLNGSQIRLAVNGIPVVSTRLRGPIPKSSSTGLLCGGLKSVEATHFQVASAAPRAFVVTKFATPYTEVYLNVIKAVCAKFGLTAIRADEIYGPGVVLQDIIEQVVTSQLVIADISEPNANVYFEVGYALAANTPIILLATRGTSLPFDVAGFRVLFYEDSIGGKARLEEGLKKHLTALLGPSAP